MNAFWTIIRRSQKPIYALLFIEDKPKGELNRGKGDVRSMHGKTARETFGNSRPKKNKQKK